MKRIITSLAFASMMLSANAQVGESVNRQITYTVETHEVEYKRTYHRVFAGTSAGIATAGSASILGGGIFEAGWTWGIPVTKQLPLYIETGLHLGYRMVSADEGYKNNDFDYNRTGFFIPVAVTYRFQMKNRLFVAPYIGANLSIGENKFKYNNDFRSKTIVNPALELGVNFDLKHFYVGLGYEYTGFTMTNRDNSDESIGGGMHNVFLRIGATINRKKRLK